MEELETFESPTTGGAETFDDMDFGEPSAEVSSPAEEHQEPAPIEQAEAMPGETDGTPGPDGTPPQAKPEVPAAPKAKTYKTKLGEQDIELPGDAKFTVPVDGKQVEVTFEDLKKDYAGRTEWNVRYQELANEKRGLESTKRDYETDRTQMRGQVTNIYRAVMDEKNPLKAFQLLAETMGAENPLQYAIEARNQIVQQYGQAEPEALKQHDIQAENEYLRQQANQARQGLQQTQNLQQLKSRMDGMLERVGAKSLEHIEALDKLHKEVLASPNYTPQQKEDPDFLGNLYVQRQRMDKVKASLDSLGSELDNKEAAIKHLSTVAEQNPDLSVDDLKDIAREVFWNKTAKSLSRKVQKTAAVKAQAPGFKLPKKEVLTFDDMDDDF